MKIVTCMVAFLLALTTSISAQENKEKLVGIITDKHTWMMGYMVDKLFTINLSPT